MRVRFLKTVQFESEGRNRGPIYRAGEVHDFDDAFAQRWLRRAVAVEEADPVVPVAETAPLSEALSQAGYVPVSEAADWPVAEGAVIVEHVVHLPSDYAPFPAAAIVTDEQPRRRGRPRKA